MTKCKSSSYSAKLLQINNLSMIVPEKLAKQLFKQNIESVSYKEKGHLIISATVSEKQQKLT